MSISCYLWVLCLTMVICTFSTTSNPRTIAHHASFDRLSSSYQLISGSILTSLFLSASQAKAQDTTTILSPYSLSAQLTNPQFTKNLFNIPPNVATYPSSFMGLWASQFKFVDAKFVPSIPIKELASDVNVAGFRKYSVAYLPDIGKDFSCTLQFKNGMKGIVEDRITDLATILQSVNAATVVDADYDPQSNPNRCSLKYTDPRSTGRIELFTNYREQTLLPKTTFPTPLFVSYQSPSPLSSDGVVTKTSPSSSRALSTNDLTDDGYRTFESLRQVTTRIVNGQRASQTTCDYALESKYYPVGDKEMVGTLTLASYLLPISDKGLGQGLGLSDKPVGVFLYAFGMTKIG